MEPVAKAVVEAPTVDTFKMRYDSLKKGRHKAYGFYARQPKLTSYVVLQLY